MQFGCEVKKLFFDRPAVMAAVERGKRRGLSKAGAFVRRRARSSIRRRKKISAAGQPPSAHSRSEPSLKTILFFYDDVHESVVIGPIAFNQRDSIPVPQLLEKGGTVTRLDRRRRKRRTLRYKPHPFMGPAMTAEAPNFPEYFHDTVY